MVSAYGKWYTSMEKVLSLEKKSEKSFTLSFINSEK